MHRSRWAAAALAVALVVLMVATALPTASQPSAPLSPTRSAPELVASDHGEYAFLSDLAAGIHVPLSQLEKARAWVDSLSPSQVVYLKGHPVPSTGGLEMVGLRPDSINAYCVGASVIAGAAIGGLIGNAPGLIIGAVAGAIGAYFECQQGGNAANTAAAWKVWVGGVMSAFGNEVNLTAGEYASILSSLNASTIAWQRAADNAALLQLGNGSFNTTLDLFQGGVYANLAPIVGAYLQQVSLEATAVFSAVNAEGYTGGTFASESPQYDYCTPTCGELQAVRPGDAQGFMAGVAMSAGGPFYLPSDPTVAIECTVSPCTSTVVTLHDLTNGNWYNYTLTQCIGHALVSASACAGTLTSPAGLYGRVYSSGGSVYVRNGQDSAASTNPNPPVNGFVNDDGQDVLFGTVGGFTFGQKLMIQGSTSDSIEVDPFAFGIGEGIYGWVNAVEWSAAQNAAAYWQFLRLAGFNSSSQVPPNCFIPAPYMVLPSAINDTSLNASEWFSLYIAALQGMGVFYNVSLNGTSFCGSTLHHHFSLGNTLWGNLAVNATGYVYLTNRTQPIDLRGKPLSSEKFGNRSTWAIGNTTYYSNVVKGPQQLLLMPTLSTVSIPVGQVWEVPTNDPIQIYAVQSQVMFKVTGNGTSTGVKASLLHVATVNPGDAIYLTSCVVGGSATSNCTVEVQTLNITVTNITQQPGPANSGGTFGGLPNPFSLLTNWLSGLFGGGPLGQAIAGIVSALIILAVIGILVYVAVVSVESWGSKKRGGGGGSSTIIVGGR